MQDDGMCLERRKERSDERNFILSAIGDLIYFCDMNVKKFISLLSCEGGKMYFSNKNVEKIKNVSKAFNIFTIVTFPVLKRTLLMLRFLFASQP